MNERVDAAATPSASLSSTPAQAPAEGLDARYGDLIQSLDAIVWEMDAQSWTFTFVSSRAEVLLGYPVERWLTEPGFWADEILHPDDRDWALEFCQAAADAGRDHEFDYRAIAADGRTVFLRDVVRVVADAGGRPLLRGVMIDISEQKRVEHELLERERQLAEAYELSQLGSWEWDVVADRVVWSDTLCRIYGLEPGEFAGTYAGYLARVHPEDRERVQRSIGETFEQGGPFDLEERIVRPDGEIRTLRSRGAAQHDEAGRVVRLVGVCQDLTEQRVAERRDIELARSEAAREQVTRILESITDAFFALDRAWRFTYVNAEAETLLRRGRDELLGRVLWQEFPDAVGSPFEREYRQAVETGSSGEFVEFYPPLDAWFEVKVFPSAEGLAVYFHDVSDRVAAEAALRESEARFRAVQETSPDGFMVFRSVRDEGGTIEDFEWVYVNPSAARITGRSAESLLGQRLLEQMPGNREEGLFDLYVHAVETGERVERVFRYEHEGLNHWFRNTAVKIGDGFAVAFADITAERRAELALEHQRDLLRTITDNATGALFMMDARGRCTFMNPAAEAMTGFTLDEVRDMPLHDAIHHRYPDGRPYPISECPIDRALPEDATVELHEDVFIRKNGEFFPVVCAARPIKRDGVPIGTVVEVRDVTHERAAQQAVRQSEQRYRSLVEASAAIVWNTPASGEFLGEQPTWTRFTGQPEAEYSGYGWLRRVHPDDREPTVAAWKRALATGELYEVEHRICRHDGEYRQMMARGVPILDDGGEILEWVGVHADVTERRRMEDGQRTLAEAGAVLASSLDYETTLASVTQLAVPAIADWCAIDVADPDGTLHRVGVGHPDPEKQRLAMELQKRYPADPNATTGVHEVLRTGEPQLMPEIPDEVLAAGAHDEEHLRIIRELGLRSAVIVPMVARGRMLGAITLVAAESGRRYDERDLELARELALRAAFAVDNARLVADLKRVLQDLQTSEQQYRFLAESMPQLVWTSTPTGDHDYFNERWHAYTGMPRDAEPGWDWQEYLHPDDREPALAVWRDCLASGEAYEVEYRFRRAADGEFRWFLGRALPLRNEAGTILKWFGTCTDIDDQKRAEADRERLIAALDVERARLSSVFMDAPAAIATLTGPDHVFEIANPRYLELVGNRPVQGLPVREALPEMVGQGFIDLLDEVFRTGEPFVGNEVAVRLKASLDAPEEERFLNFVYQPVTDAGGTVTGIFVHAVEVTAQVEARHEVERKAEELGRLAAALERSNSELDQFAYVTSHDLKAPLRGIGNLAQWIEEDLGDDLPSEVSEHLELLKGRVHRMEGLIEGILQYSRADRLQSGVETVDVAALIDEVVELLDPPEGVAVDLAPELPTLDTERLPLQQVFMNLIGNAVKYLGRDHGRVRVEARRRNGFHEFSVADDGPGIAPEYHDRIFGIFQTLQARDRIEGTGIGLSLVKKIVEHRGGRVWVESEEGSGATFRFTWPA